MPGSHKLPAGDDPFSRWLDQFLAAATDNATALGLSPADLTALGNRITEFKTGLAGCAAAEAAAKQATAVKNNSRTLIEQLVRKLAKRFTTEPGYTPALGELLGIISAASVEGGASAAPMSMDDKPAARVKALPDYQAEIRPRMKGAEAVDIYCQRDGDAAPVLLGRFTHARYVDERGPLVAGKPEKRNYFIQLIRNDAHWGPMSDPISVICSA